MSDPTLFAESDPALVLAEALAVYEAETDVDLQPADPRRLHLQAFLLMLTQQRSLINYAGLQSIVQYVSDEWIDELAEFLGAERLPAGFAETILRVTMSTEGPHVIAAGKRATGGGFLWEMPQITVGIGELTADATGTCTTDGTDPNGLAPGQINEMADSVEFLDSVVNITKTDDGTDIESTEDFRERLRTVPNGWSVAGPREAYEALTDAVSSAIIGSRAIAFRDNGSITGAAVDKGVVRVLVLALGGASATLLQSVSDALSAETVRPMTDAVETDRPEPVDLSITATYYIGSGSSGDAEEIQTAVDAAWLEYLEWQTTVIGRDVNPDKLSQLVVSAGAKRIDVGAFVFAVLTIDQVAVIPSAVQGLIANPTIVGDGTVVITETAGEEPAVGFYWAICLTAKDGATPAVFQISRQVPSTPPLVAEVDADGALHSVLGLDVTITEGGTTFEPLDLWVFSVVASTLALTYGGIEDE